MEGTYQVTKQQTIDLTTPEGKSAWNVANGGAKLAGEKSNRVAAKAKSPAVPKGMNKLEQRMQERLLGELMRGEIAWFGFECMTLKLASDCRYTCDFIIIHLDGSIEGRETKGFFRDDAKVKIKVAARMFQWMTFSVWKWTKNGWQYVTITP